MEVASMEASPKPGIIIGKATVPFVLILFAALFITLLFLPLIPAFANDAVQGKASTRQIGNAPIKADGKFGTCLWQIDI